jgi:DNA mismatch endonuclease (patch repair protein)
MVDVHTIAQRSKNMRAIRAKNTAPEMQVRRLLFARGFRYRVHVKSLPGSPDLVLAKHKVVIFIHGCFWHGHGCHLFKVPGTRTEFWMKKIQSNRDRDFRAEEKLLLSKWRILYIWECALKGRLKRPIEEVVHLAATWITARDCDAPTLTIRHV